MRVGPDLRERMLNMIWASCTMYLAVDSLKVAVETAHVQGFIFFSIHLLVALLFLIRHRQLKRSSYFLGYAVAIASTFYVYLFEFDSSASQGLVFAGEFVGIVGSVFALASILSLGKCFGVLPNLRGVQTKYLYSIIRHPIYSSYILMDIGIVLSFPSFFNLAILVLAIILYVVRIYYEELLLCMHQAYSEYTSRVRFKLFPHLY